MIVRKSLLISRSVVCDCLKDVYLKSPNDAFGFHFAAYVTPTQT